MTTCNKQTDQHNRMNPMKLILLGPSLGGKTVLANFLADAKDNSTFEYRPTQGCRILEFRLEKNRVLDKNQSLDIQLWDCSGDLKFESCWPAIAKDAVAVLLVYDVTNEDQVNDLHEITRKWQSFLDLPPSRYLVVARRWSPNDGSFTIKKGTLSRLQRVEWDLERDSLAVQSEFASFVKSVVADINQRREEEETGILRG